MGHEKLLTVQDICDQLQVRKEWVYAIVRRGDLKRIKIGKEFRFRQTDLDAYLERNTA